MKFRLTDDRYVIICPSHIRDYRMFHISFSVQEKRGYRFEFLKISSDDWINILRNLRKEDAMGYFLRPNGALWKEFTRASGHVFINLSGLSQSHT